MRNPEFQEGQFMTGEGERSPEAETSVQPVERRDPVLEHRRRWAATMNRLYKGLTNVKDVFDELAADEREPFLRHLLVTDPDYLDEAARSGCWDGDKAALLAEVLLEKRPSCELGLAVWSSGVDEAEFLRLSQSMPTLQRDMVWRGLRVPTRADGNAVDAMSYFTQSELDWFEAGERPETMTRDEWAARESRKVSEELGAWITAECSELHETEAERRRIETELLANFDVTQRIANGDANTNLPLAAHLVGREKPVVYKPRAREAPLRPGQTPLRKGIAPGRSAEREWLTGQVSRILAPDTVPVSVLRDGPEGFGSVQDWRIGQKCERERLAEIIAMNLEAYLNVEGVGIVHAATGNSDGHSGNVQTAIGDNRVYSIDNECTFGDRVDEGDGLRSVALDVMGGKPLTGDATRRVRRYVETPVLRKAVADCFTVAFGPKEGRRRWKTFEKNVRDLLKQGLPKAEWR